MFSDCVFNVWSPKIADPHMMGWITVAFYFMAAMQALFVSSRVQYVYWGEDERRNRYFWLFLMVLLVLLGLNKQFDLNSYFTALTRCYSYANGWYEERRQWQVLFILFIGGLFIYSAFPRLRYCRDDLSHNRWAIIGVSFMLAFIFIRASSFHYFDSVIGYEIGGVRMNWILELSGILLIFMQSLINLRTGKLVPITVSSEQRS